jgi:hypothetical protein
MVSVWPEPLSAKPAEPSAGVCDGKEALALTTSETPPNWCLIDQVTPPTKCPSTPQSHRRRSACEGVQWLATHEAYVLRRSVTAAFVLDCM